MAKTKKPARKSPAKVGPPARPPTRHPDSVVVPDDEDVIDVTPDPPAPSRALARREAPKPAPVVRREEPDAGAVARELVMQAKTAMMDRPSTLPVQVTLVLENAAEIDAAMLLEHQGRGRLFKTLEGFAFEFNEESVGGILRGDSLQYRG